MGSLRQYVMVRANGVNQFTGDIWGGDKDLNDTPCQSIIGPVQICHWRYNAYYMNREELLKLLRKHEATLSRRFGITDSSLYGSFAREDAADHSDAEFLVRFKAPPKWRQYFAARAYLEGPLGRPVDMATRREIRAEIRPYVEREAANV